MTHHSRLCALVLDCEVDDLRPAIAFWSAALGKPVADPDEDGDGRYAVLATAHHEPMILLQKVSHDSRVHLDIEADDVDAEAQRLERLGARKVAFVKRWWVMEAPTGHRFCVVRPQRGDLDARANRWE